MCLVHKNILGNERKGYMKKYEFIKNGMDDYTLKYKDKTINFNSKVEYKKDLEECTKNARLRMVVELTKAGLTVKDLVQEKKVNGKTLVDNSSKEFMEQTFIEEEQRKVFDNIAIKLLGMSLTDIIIDIGLTDESETNEFFEDFGNIIVGNFPSK